MHTLKPSFRPFARDLAAIVAVAALLVSKWCGAAESSEPAPKPRCSVVYINGDAVISCPKGVSK